jgi:hypothetical protein
MNLKLIETLLLTGAAVAVPTMASAAPQSAAMDSCVSAFMQSLAKHSAPLKLRESRLLTSGMTSGLVPPAAGSELVLIATDVRDNHTVGRAICRLDAHGQVTGLEEVPASSPLPL